MSTKFASPVDVDLGANPHRVIFNTTEEAQAWIEAEQRTWNSFLPQDGGGARDSYKSALNAQREQIVAVRTAIDEAVGNAAPSPDRVTNALRDAYRNGKALHAESTYGKAVLVMAANAKDGWDRDVALGFLAAAIRHPPNLLLRNNRGMEPVLPLIVGTTVYQGTVPGASDPKALIDDAARQVFGKWQETMAAHEHRITHVGEQLNDYATKIADQLATHNQSFEEASSARKEQFEQHEKEHNERIAQIENIYHEKILTEAPALYWKQKRAVHRKVGIVLCSLFLVAATAIAIYAFSVGSGLFSELSQQIEQAPQAQAMFAVESVIARMLVFIVPGFFAVWGLRILLRLGLSNLALADDAAHRYTLTLMFRSLLEHEKKNVSEADRILMLQALFRPTPGAGADDDAAPPNWFDTLLQRIKK